MPVAVPGNMLCRAPAPLHAPESTPPRHASAQWPCPVLQAFAKLPPMGFRRDEEPNRLYILVDGSATPDAWGAGAGIVGASFERVAGDGLARYNWCGGGPRSTFLSELHYHKDDKDATAEAMALLAGVILNIEYCQENDCRPLHIVVDRASGMSNLGGCGNPGPRLRAVLEHVARNLLWLLARHGRVVFLNKKKLGNISHLHSWLPDGLATRGRKTGNVPSIHAAPLPAHWREWFNFSFDGPPNDLVSLTVSLKSPEIGAAYESCWKLSRTGSTAALSV